MKNKRKHIRHAVVLILAVASLINCTAPFSASSGLAYAQAAAPSWSYTGGLNTPRSGHTATLLPNGKVLVTGGSNADGILASAELYNPSTGTWSPTGNLNAPRIYHSATLLQNGKVLVAGGWANSCCQELPDTTAELYDPATGLWGLTGNLNARRVADTATLLSNGKVLFAGGYYSKSAELYNPETGTWSFTGNLLGPRGGHAATLLRDGKVLVVGGCGDEECFFELGSAELYDPNTGAWSNTGGLSTSRYYGFTITTLPNGGVLLVGGACCFSSTTLRSAHLYNPATGQWSDTGNLLSGRYLATATLLPSGQVLVAGGYSNNPGPSNYVNSAELYDPATGNWHQTASLNTERSGHTATLLLNGKVLVVGGGSGSNNLLQSAELYDSGNSSTINPIDEPQFFVRQQYLDFLSREPDTEGLAYWANKIISCGGDSACIDNERVNVSAAFFLSIEFQETGYLVYRTHKAAYGNLNGAPVSIRLNEFLPDTQQIGQGVIVNQPGWQQLLESNQQSFFAGFVQRARFSSALPTSLTPDQFVDQLFMNAGVAPAGSDRAAAVNEFSGAANTADTAARARALRRVAENAALAQQEFNRAFVLMQYFGYLRRNPNDLPDSNFEGYHYWLNKLDQFNGNYINAEMVKAFIDSIEYRQRFGS